MIEHPEIIFRLFSANKTMLINPHGIYVIMLFVDGKWKKVLLDDYFPCDKWINPAFSKPVN